MKILYAVQATGNGHISRAIELMPYLEKLGEVDVMLSGANATLNAPFYVKYRSKGLSLFYSKCGGLHYRRMWQENSLFRAYREAKALPVENYDLVLNDFDFITAKACALKNVASVQFGHQASFMSSLTPRPATQSVAGEWVLRNYAPATHYVGLHFDQYDDFIFPPVIKQEILHADVRNDGHITVYLSAYEQDCLQHHFEALSYLHFHWFLPGVKQPFRRGNISYFPVDNALFNKSLINCHGLITGGGFETPAEALYLQKRLMCIPIRGQYEQRCNAAALSAKGITVLEDADTDEFAGQIEQWLQMPDLRYRQLANDVPSTLEMVISLSAGKQNTMVA